MPSTSKKQAHTMAAVAHGWKPPSGSGIDIPKKVAKDFFAADQKAAKHDKHGHRVGSSHDGSSRAMARGGSAFSSASTVTEKASDKCCG